jgi:hypothetical protein
VNDRPRRILNPDRSTSMPTPAQWVARLANFREMVEMSVEAERLRERVRSIESAQRARGIGHAQSSGCFATQP